jgi:hypothetical protein
MSGRAAASLVRSDPGTNRGGAWRRSGDRGPTPSRLSQARIGQASRRSQLGRTPTVLADFGGRSRLLEALAGQCRHWQPGSGFPHSRGPGATPWPAGQAVGGLPAAGPPWLAQGGPGHPPSQEPARSAGGLEKKLPEVLEALLKKDAVKGRRVRLMFQDEARFGRMVRIRRCWAPALQRPVVDNGYEREFHYVYGAVSPREGEMDWMICPAMNTDYMATFLAQVSAAHPKDFIVMVVDGASSHVAKALVVPENIRLHRLPGYSPELNPQEHLWDELREKEFPNRVFSDMAGVVRTLEAGLPRLAADRDRVRSICAWPWIVSLIWNANENKQLGELQARGGFRQFPLQPAPRLGVAFLQAADPALDQLALLQLPLAHAATQTLQVADESAQAAAATGPLLVHPPGAATGHIDFVRLRKELHLDLVRDFLPVALQQVLFVGLELAFGRAHQIVRAALEEQFEVCPR